MGEWERHDVEGLRRRAEEELGVPAALHDFQWEGVAFLYGSRAALLGDEMGLGKTVQTSVALSLLVGKPGGVSRAIVVAPAALTRNWTEELAKWAPGLTVRRVSGSQRARTAYYLLPIPVLVASYEQIRADALHDIPQGTFDLVVLDEAQRIKNRHSSTAFACRLLPRKRAWALSATPLENSPEDVASILSFLDSSVGGSAMGADLVDRLHEVMLRRRKHDVRRELPPVVVKDLRIDLSTSQRVAYDLLWANRALAIRGGETRARNTVVLGVITKLKILCNYDERSGSSSKFEAFETFLEGVGSNARILVFSQFVETLKWVSERLHVPNRLLVGSMRMDARQDAIRWFMTGHGARILLVSLRAGGVGLNLGNATHVVLFDRWWNRAVEDQAVYRAHRFERDTELNVLRFLVMDTIEEHIARILDHKDRLFSDIVESAKSSGYRLTQSDLLRILELSLRDVTDAFGQPQDQE